MYMQFALITDIHYWPQASYRWKLRKITNNAKTLVDQFIAEMSTVVHPEFVIVWWDMIEESNEETDIGHLTYIKEQFGKLSCPVYYVTGNHDLIHLSQQQVQEVLELDQLYYSFETEEYHGIILFSQDHGKGNIISIPEQQLERLKEELKKADKKCLVFVHHGLADQDVSNNLRFEWIPHRCLIDNRESVRDILEQSWKVVAVFNSHLHRDKMHIHNNIPYYTIQSLTENENDWGIASETHAIVTINSDHFSQVEIKRNYPKVFSFPE